MGRGKRGKLFDDLPEAFDRLADEQPDPPAIGQAEVAARSQAVALKASPRALTRLSICAGVTMKGGAI